MVACGGAAVPRLVARPSSPLGQGMRVDWKDTGTEPGMTLSSCRRSRESFPVGSLMRR
jgi:hypothetical protein